jgi:hypothetical protein
MVTVFRHMDVHVSMSALRRHVVNISGERRDLFPVPHSLCNTYVPCTVHSSRCMHSNYCKFYSTYENSFLMCLKALKTVFIVSLAMANYEIQI